jgi:hypothetical protein
VRFELQAHHHVTFNRISRNDSAEDVDPVLARLLRIRLQPGSPVFPFTLVGVKNEDVGRGKDGQQDQAD